MTGGASAPTGIRTATLSGMSGEGFGLLAGGARAFLPSYAGKMGWIEATLRAAQASMHTFFLAYEDQLHICIEALCSAAWSFGRSFGTEW